ncbi:hypothetical protein SESBI_24511 [Sesbania bispinosa]|nr:hypothetical protein SESBI_24511 [Sesbania bispinosa]
MAPKKKPRTRAPTSRTKKTGASSSNSKAAPRDPPQDYLDEDFFSSPLHEQRFDNNLMGRQFVRERDVRPAAQVSQLTTHALQSILKNQHSIHGLLNVIARHLNVPEDQFVPIQPLDELNQQFLRLGVDHHEADAATDSDHLDESWYCSIV